MPLEQDDSRATGMPTKDIHDFVVCSDIFFPLRKRLVFIRFSSPKEVQGMQARCSLLRLLVWTTQSLGEGGLQYLKVRAFYTKIKISSFKTNKKKKNEATPSPHSLAARIGLIRAAAALQMEHRLPTVPTRPISF